MKNDFSGMLLFDKPKSITSFKAVNKIRKILNIKKAGHCGTLDPAATGLLLILTGKATKLQRKFMKRDKVYLSSFLLGTTTDSGDLDGTIIEQKEVKDINIKEIKNALNVFKGEIEQIPPMYCALKYKGKKLYELARKGIIVERKPRKVTIKDIEVLSFSDNILKVRVSCSSGTYIRSLAEDIGNFLGSGAVVSELRREKIGDFRVEDALKMEDLVNVEKIISGLINMEKLQADDEK
ncbi:MAG: tRNA pseudouridine(55) synthase TruB [Endomicrobium sp.]|jgi:tRNA pseudouridine55 synthase|nr:tRNA pseudouridine(55) synthase TruB [Endomicrobium sp.]